MAAALAAGAVAAQEGDKPSGPSGIRFSGFGSVGLSRVQAPAGWGYRRELSQSGADAAWRHDLDSRLGAQLNYGLGTQLEVVAQAIARKRGHYAADGDVVEWAYLSYRPNAEWTLRAGRVNLDAFLMADYRNVGYGFMTARPPVELYAMLPTTLDGSDIARSWFHGEAQWRVKLMAGAAQIGDLQIAEPSRIRRVLGGMVSREEGGLLLRASFARTRIDIDLSGAQQALAGLDQLSGLPIPMVAEQARRLRERLGGSAVWATFWQLGLRHELADWQWSAELARISARPLIDQTSAYATLGRRFGDWTPYLAYGHTRDAMPLAPAPLWQAVLTPVIGPAAAAGAQMLGSAVTDSVNRSRVQQSSWSLGARWDFHPQAALKLQWDRVRVGAGGAGLWTGGDVAARRANVATAVVDFIF